MSESIARPPTMQITPAFDRRTGEPLVLLRLDAHVFVLTVEGAGQLGDEVKAVCAIAEMMAQDLGEYGVKN